MTKEELHDRQIEILIKGFQELSGHCGDMIRATHKLAEEMAIAVEKQRQALMVHDSKINQLADIQKSFIRDIIAKIQELAVVVGSHHRQLNGR